MSANQEERISDPAPVTRPNLDPSSQLRILVVGSPGFTSVGESLVRGARSLGHVADFVDAWQPYEAPVWLRRVNWRLRDRKPTHLRRFGRELVGQAREVRPHLVVVTGQLPVTAEMLRALGALGARRANFSTDDPWNRNSGSRWFRRALREYDAVFTPRHSNEEDLRALGGPAIHYLPFAYDPVHCVGPPLSEDDRARYTCDVVFVGGADADRAPLIRPIVESGLNVHLYGDKWDRYTWAHVANQGQATPEVLRKATLGAAVSLCLVRRSNRDGHVMRTFEMAAAGACMLVEWTAEHEALLGKDGENVVYFRTDDELLDRARSLQGDAGLRTRLGECVGQWIASHHHTYRDRMADIITLTMPPSA